MTQEFFATVPGRIPFGGPDAADALAFRVYEPDRVVLGRPMVDWLRPGPHACGRPCRRSLQLRVPRIWALGKPLSACR